MTELQKELYELLLRENSKSQKAGEPFFPEPKELKKIASRCSDAQAEKTLAFYEDNEPIESTPGDSARDEISGFCELALWLVYLNHDADNLTDWSFFREIISKLYQLYDQRKNFIPIAQSRGINALPELVRSGVIEKDLEGNKKAQIGDVSFYLQPDFPALSVQDCKLHDVLLSEYYKTRNLSVVLPLRDYAFKCGRKTTKSALKDLRKEVYGSLKALSNISYECTEKINGVDVPSGILRINGGTALIKNSCIYYNFNYDLKKFLDNMAPLDLSVETLLADPRTNQYHFSRWIDQCYRMNESKDGFLKISIQSFLKHSPMLPDIDTVREKRQSARKKIIEPFFRDMDATPRYYDFYTKDGQRIDDFTALDYETFAAGSVLIDVSDYPAHSSRLTAKKARAKRAKKGGEVDAKGGGSRRKRGGKSTQAL